MATINCYGEKVQRTLWRLFRQCLVSKQAVCSTVGLALLITGFLQSVNAGGVLYAQQTGAASTPSTNPLDRKSVTNSAPKPAFVSSARRLLVAPELSELPLQWTTNSLAWVNYILESYPPSSPEYPARRAALTRMDDILHVESAAHQLPVQQFYKARMEQAIEQIEYTQVQEGVQVWKLYNHGFFIKTKSVSFAFDIVPPDLDDPGFAITPEQIHRIAVQADALFISHEHSDHASKRVVQAFLDLRKPVIAPVLNDVWKDDPDLKCKLIHLTRSTSASKRIQLPGKTESLMIIAYPGHQDEIENNVYLVTTPEGYSVVHTGDQWMPLSDVDFGFFKDIGREHHVDILLPNVWTRALPVVISSVHPELVITGHENEMGHAVSHREDYVQSYERLFGVSTPYLVMTWGETFHYRPAQEVDSVHCLR